MALDHINKLKSICYLYVSKQGDQNSVDTDQQYIIKKSDFLCFPNCFKSSTKVNVNWIPFALAGIH